MNRLNELLHGDAKDAANILSYGDELSHDELTAALINALNRIAALEKEMQAGPPIAATGNLLQSGEDRQMTDIQIRRDTIAEKLDEMADLSEHWKRNREKGRDQNAIRAAMLMLSHEVTLIAQQQDRETAEMMDKPTAYHDLRSR